MAVPKIKLWIYPGGSPTDSSTWGLPVDISARIRYPGSDGGQAINYSGGRQDEAARVDAGRMTLSLDNRDGRFSITNPYGPYYGKLRRGTPIVLATESFSDSFNRSGANLGPGWSVSSFSANGSAATATFAAAGSIGRPIRQSSGCLNGEGRFTTWVDQVATGAPFVTGALIRAANNLNHVQVRLEFGTDGLVATSISRLVNNVIFTDATTATGLTYTPGQRFRVRWQADGGRVHLKTWKPANLALPDADEPAAWSVSVNMTYAPGAQQGLLAWRLGGNTNTGMAGFIDDYSSDAYEFVGQIASLPLNWDRSGNNSWAALEAAGPMRRLQQGAGALMSPLRRMLSSYNPTGYWPLEDGGDSTTFGSAVAGVGPASGGNVTPASDSSLPGALTAPTFTAANSRLQGNTQKRRKTANRRTDGVGWSVIFLAKLQQATGNNTMLATFYATGTARRWRLWLDGTPAGPVNYRLEYFDSAGTLIDTTTLSAPPINYQQWVAWHLHTDWSDGVTQWYLHTAQIGGSGFYRMAGGLNEPGSPPQISAVTLGGTELNGAAVSHLWMGPSPFYATTFPTPFLSPSFQLVANGYRGELAGDRALRTSQEQGTSLILESGTVETMGAQRPGSFLDNMRAAEEAEFGVLYESGSGLGFRPRTARYQRVADFEVYKTFREIADAPVASEDDQNVRNSWTVSRDGGSSVTARDEDHIASEGIYEDSATLNVATDAALSGHAFWRTYLGTRPGYRWPSVVLDLEQNAFLAVPWRSRSYGHRFRMILGGLAQVPGETPDLILEGWSAQLWPYGWRIDANCSPAQWWDVPAVVTSTVDPLGGQIDSETSTLSIAISETTTNLGVNIANAVGWTTTTLPLLVTMNGETMRVTIITPLSAPVGGSQTFIVERGVNGVTRSHPVGSVISLATPTYLGL